MSKPALQEQPDFSLVLGGPLYQLFRRAHLAGNALELSRRRMIVISGLAWVPLLLLSVAGGHALGGTLEIPFLYDVEAHARFLIALPLLVAAELIVHLRMRPVVLQFVERRIIAPDDIPQFREAIESTLRLRNSMVGEVTLAVVVYTVGIWVWLNQSAIEAASWYALPSAGRMNPTWAGYWYFFVSLPIFQFIVLRWYLRFGLWFWFLWKVSRLNLRLIPIHPDRTAGLSFLATSTNAYAPILFAQGVLLAGMIANQIFYGGQTLLAFKGEIVALVGFFVVAILTPLTVFAPRLARVKRQGQREFGKLASRYVDEFEGQWMRDATVDRQLLGSSDIQSLADLSNSYGAVQGMRVVPYTVKDVTRLAVTAAAPLLPLTLTMFSVEQVVAQLVKVLL